MLSGKESKRISWAIVDYLGAIVMAIGTCLYNVSCTTPAVLVCLNNCTSPSEGLLTCEIPEWDYNSQTGSWVVQFSCLI